MSTTTTRYEFTLPDPGEGLTEAEIVEWHITEGGEVEEDDILCEVETDKAVTEVPSPCPGTIEELIADVGEMVQVGEVIVVFETKNPPAGQEVEETDEDEEAEQRVKKEAEEDEIEESKEQTEEKEPEETIKESEEAEKRDGDEERIFAAPSTRRYARDQDIELSDVTGTGPSGRILREDIDAYLDERETQEPLEAEGTTAPSALPHPTVDIEPVSIDEDESRSERRDLSGLRARIAENMAESRTIIPHVTSGFEADATELVALKERLDEKHDTRITYTPLLVKAIVPALKEFPMINASVDDETNEIVEKHYYNIGVATHTEDGLLVPVIKNVDTKSLVTVAAEVQQRAEEARNRSIDITDLRGGTFTVTNVGSHGGHGTFGTPIINHPEAAIIGIGGIENKPVAVTENDIEIQKRLGLTLSFDHRIIDGVTANQFMEYVIQGIEDPDLLLSQL
jgi:pyruvate dehydrogenase E2 component (dihydrolipoamide acetyltransferase)